MTLTGTTANGAKIKFSPDAVVEYSRQGNGAKVWLQMGVCVYSCLMVDDYKQLKKAMEERK